MMKNKITLTAILLVYSFFAFTLKSQAQTDTTNNKLQNVPQLSYGFKLNLVNLVYNPFSQTSYFSFLYPDNAFVLSYPSPAVLIKDLKGNTHEIEIHRFMLDRIDKDLYFQDFAIQYQYDVNLSKAKNLKTMPLLAPYLIAGYAGTGGSGDSIGRYYSNELYAKLGIGLGARYNINSKMFIDVIPSIKLTHFYWLSGRTASNPVPQTYSTNQLLKFEFKDVFFKAAMGYWF